MSKPFDPYRKWLGIPERFRPPSHYELLAIHVDERDLDVIRAAVIQRSAYVRNFQRGEQAEAATKLLNEIAAAEACLTHPTRRAAYDAELKRARGASQAAAPPTLSPLGPVDAALEKIAAMPVTPVSSLWQQPARRRGLTPLHWTLIGAGGLGLLGIVVVVLVASSGRDDASGVARNPEAPVSEAGDPQKPAKITPEKPRPITGAEVTTANPQPDPASTNAPSSEEPAASAADPDADNPSDSTDATSEGPVAEASVDLATKTEARGEGAAEPELATIEELPPNAFNSAPWLSSDGLTLYFVSYAQGEKQGWIWSGRRKDKDSLFEDFERLLPGSDPVVTADGLELILNNQTVLRSATRKATDEKFGRPRRIAELENAGPLSAPSLSADGLTLYADRWPKGATDFRKANDRVRFQRGTRSSKWGPAEVVEITGLPSNVNGTLRFLSVSEDELRGFVMLRTGEITTNRVLVLSRQTSNEPFEATSVVSIGGDDRFAAFPRWVESTGELFCMKADESKNLRMVVIRNFDFDTATAPLDLDNSSAAAPRDDEATQQALQGEWLTVREEANGNVPPADEVSRRKRRIVIDGTSFNMTRVIGGKSGTYEGRFEIDAATGHFDWRGKGPRGANTSWRGIYELDGDTLKLCYKYVKDGSTTRPTEFKTDNKAGTNFIYLVLERQQ